MEIIHGRQEDEEEEEHYNLRKSKFWLSKADVCIWLFFGRGYDNGVGVELGYANGSSSDILSNSIFAFRESEWNEITSLIRGCVQHYDSTATVVQYDSTKDLLEQCRGAIEALLDKLVADYNIRNRRINLWEYHNT